MHGYEVKGFHFRGILLALDALGVTEEVRRHVPPDVAAHFDQPPPVSAWVDGRVMDAVSEGVLAVGGADAVRRVQRLAIGRGAMTVLRPVVESVVRALGVSPAMIIRQLNFLQSSAVRGIEHRFEVRGPSSGLLVTTVVGTVPASFFEGTAGSMEALAELCGVTAVVPPPVVTVHGDRTEGRLEITWSRARASSSSRPLNRGR